VTLLNIISTTKKPATHACGTSSSSPRKKASTRRNQHRPNNPPQDHVFVQLQRHSAQMSGLFGSTPAASAGSTTGDTSKDVEIPQNQLPGDSISDLQFSPTNDFLAVSSWDQKVYIYEVNNSGANGKWFFTCKGPVLAVAWSTVSEFLETIVRARRPGRGTGLVVGSKRSLDLTTMVPSSHIGSVATR
jgi:WD40 repeat protein